MGLLATTFPALAGETLFTNGPQEHEGTSYYWIAEWKLEVTLPADVAADDRFEVLFGSKGPAKRTLRYSYKVLHNDRPSQHYGLDELVTLQPIASPHF